ncbi:MAG TPA: hypothetical protein VF831_08995 [Anaerolineales bacterium]
MSSKFLALFLAFALLLAACTGGGLPERATQGGIRPTTNSPTPYPLPQVSYPTSTPMTYPEPSPSETASHSLPSSSYEPQSGDENLSRDTAFVDLSNSHVVLSASDLSQVNVILQGNLPDGCHKLRVVVPQPDANHTINLDVFSLVDPASTCLAQLAPFTASIQLGSYSNGQYVVNVNGEKLGEFGTNFAQQPGDDLLRRGEVAVHMENSELLTIGTQPVQAIAILRGNSPAPCNPLRLVLTPSNDNSAINLEVYSLIDPKQNCLAVLQPFEIAILLDTSESGHYSVYINGEVLGEFGQGYEPQPGDENLMRGEVFIDVDSSKLLTSGTQPIQVTALLQGNLPDPCHRLRLVAAQPDKSNSINLEVYSLADPGVICITVLRPFEASVPLGSFPGGHYTVYVNGELLGEFDG